MGRKDENKIQYNMKVTDKIEITNEDNMELMARYPDNYFDLAIVDPPYGIDITNSGWAKSNKKIKTSVCWDNEIPKEVYFKELFRVSKEQIIWGGNYFLDYLTKTRCFLIWDKQIGECTSFASSELAWTSFDKSTKTYYDHPAKYGKEKFHPTQKPVKLYEWLLMNYAKEGDKILDTHLGSGSIAIACHNLGFELTACELDEEYFLASIDRFQTVTSQQRLF
jgi:site-specific DNA-methyltransferase (adenine-specific)